MDCQITPMTPAQWCTVLALAIAPIPLCEWAKAAGRKGERTSAKEPAVK